MIRSTILALAIIAVAEPVLAQGNNNDNTPLNSRIARDREFPTEPRNIYHPRDLSDLQRRRSETMVDSFAACLWSRSNEDGIDLIDRTDFGFRDFQQIGIPNAEVGEHYAVETCLDRIARNYNSSVRMRFDAESMRRWYLFEAYMDRYENGPLWIQPGLVIAERDYPLSANNPAVHSAMDFIDCVIIQNPYAADYFYRTGPDSEDEKHAIAQIVPAIEPCVIAGQELDISPFTLRVWLGEGLWHAANNSTLPTADETQDQE